MPELTNCCAASQQTLNKTNTAKKAVEIIFGNICASYGYLASVQLDGEHLFVFPFGQYVTKNEKNACVNSTAPSIMTNHNNNFSLSFGFVSMMWVFAVALLARCRAEMKSKNCAKKCVWVLLNADDRRSQVLINTLIYAGVRIEICLCFYWTSTNGSYDRYKTKPSICEINFSKMKNKSFHLHWAGWIRSYAFTPHHKLYYAQTENRIPRVLCKSAFAAFQRFGCFWFNRIPICTERKREIF